MTRETEDRTLRPSATARYKFSGLRLPQGEGIGPDQLRFYRELKQWIDLREGALGNSQERVVLKRDLDEVGINSAMALRLIASGQAPIEGQNPGGPVGGINSGNGSNVRSVIDEFAKQIVSSRVFQNLMKGTNDPTRFSDFSDEVQAILLRRIDEEAKARGAAIRRIEQIVQTDSLSQAIAVQEVTASVFGAMAGVRTTTFATAQTGRATAGQVTQVTARLDDFDGAGATVEEVMFAQADSLLGLEAQYTLKVTAGGAFAGIGLAASSPIAGPSSSAILMTADKFAIVKPGYTGGLVGTPPAGSIPFGVDAVTGRVTIDGSLLVSGTVSAGSLTAGDATGIRGGVSLFGINNILQITRNSATFSSAMSISDTAATPTPSFGILTSSSHTGGTAVNFVSNATTTITLTCTANGASASGGRFISPTKSVTLASASYAVHSVAGQGKHYAVDGLGPFTGFHDAMMALPLLEGDYQPQVGDIVVDEELVLAMDVNNSLFTATECREADEMGAIGVISDMMEIDDGLELPYETWWFYQHTHLRLQVNGVGEGQINVCGRGGNLSRGDLIVCSDMPGKGMRQADRLVRSNTVARVRIAKGGSVVFSHPDEVKLVPCVYLCG